LDETWLGTEEEERDAWVLLVLFINVDIHPSVQICLRALIYPHQGDDYRWQKGYRECRLCLFEWPF
jgi:hypothetical protein